MGIHVGTRRKKKSKLLVINNVLEISKEKQNGKYIAYCQSGSSPGLEIYSTQYKTWAGGEMVLMSVHSISLAPVKAWVTRSQTERRDQ